MRGLRLLSKVLEENPNHVSAGSPAGGQFAKGGGRGNSGLGKEIWQMTKSEYERVDRAKPAKTILMGAPKNYELTHRYKVQFALKRGDPVPAKVLREYPDLVAKYKGK